MFIAASSGVTGSTAVSSLQKTANGEYTAGSVAMNPNEAFRLFLTRQDDGNYAALSSPLARSTNGVRSAIFSLNLGG